MVMSTIERVAFVPQAALGTGVTPSDANGGIVVPVIPGTFRATEHYEQILDRGHRTGRNSMDFRAIQGVGWTEITWDGYVQLGRDTSGNPKTGIGYLLANLLGADGTAAQIDAVAAYDHRLIQGVDKEYLTIAHDIGGATADREFEGCRVTEIRIRWNNGEGPLTYTVNLVGRIQTSVAFPSVTDYNGDPWRGWHCRARVNGVGDIDAGTGFVRCISGEWTLRREPTRHHGGANIQNYQDLYLGSLEVTCSMILDFNVGATELAVFRARSQGELATLFRVGTMDAASEKTFAIGCAVADAGEAPADLDNSNPNVRLPLTFRGLDSEANGPFSSSSNAATAQNGSVQVHIVQPNSGIYDLDLGTT